MPAPPPESDPAIVHTMGREGCTTPAACRADSSGSSHRSAIGIGVIDLGSVSAKSWAEPSAPELITEAHVGRRVHHHHPRRPLAMRLRLPTLGAVGLLCGVPTVRRSRPAVSVEWDPPQLPSDALVIVEPDADVWNGEIVEHNGLNADPLTPRPLQSYLGSFQLPPSGRAGDAGQYCHAFEGGGVALAEFDWRSAANLTLPMSDDERLALVFDVLDAVSARTQPDPTRAPPRPALSARSAVAQVNHLHCRGAAHLDLNSLNLRVAPVGTDGRSRLLFVGLGAAVRLQVRRKRFAYQVSSRAGFNAPELLSTAPLLESNLRSLLLMDAWSVGVLVTMICGSANESPFDAEPTWSKRQFTKDDATRAAIDASLGAFAGFLSRIDAGGGGFLFRHGWLVRIIIGMLTRDPARRLTVHDAWRIARDNRPQPPAAPAPTHSVVPPPLKATPGARPPGAPPALSRFRKDVPTNGKQSAEPFRSLEAMVNIAERGRTSVLIEKRERWPGVKNYGEVIGFRNRADGDRWDVFVPGLDYELDEVRTL